MTKFYSQSGYEFAPGMFKSSDGHFGKSFPQPPQSTSKSKTLELSAAPNPFQPPKPLPNPNAGRGMNCAFLEGSPAVQRERKRAAKREYDALGIVNREDVMDINEIAINWAKGNPTTAYKMLNESAAPREVAPGLYNAEEVCEFFAEKTPLYGARAYARVHADGYLTERERGQKFSLMVENAPKSHKITLEAAADRYFKGNGLAAINHLNMVGLRHAKDREGQYLEKYFR